MRAPRNILLLVAFCWFYLFAVGPSLSPTTLWQTHHLSSCGDDLANSDLVALNTALQAVIIIP
jgi:hypothetical protein